MQAARSLSTILDYRLTKNAQFPGPESKETDCDELGQPLSIIDSYRRACATIPAPNHSHAIPRPTFVPRRPGQSWRGCRGRIVAAGDRLRAEPRTGARVPARAPGRGDFDRRAVRIVPRAPGPRRLHRRVQPGSPLADARGFRTDVAREIKELGVPTVRYREETSSRATTGSMASGRKPSGQRCSSARGIRSSRISSAPTSSSTGARWSAPSRCSG